MDGLRCEEARRQKAAILKHFGLTEKTDKKSVPRHVHRRLRAYGRHGGHTLFDRLFAGQTVSTIVCEECAYSSQMYEQFLDRRLPGKESYRNSRNMKRELIQTDNMYVAHNREESYVHCQDLSCLLIHFDREHLCSAQL